MDAAMMPAATESGIKTSLTAFEGVVASLLPASTDGVVVESSRWPRGCPTTGEPRCVSPVE